MHSLLGVGASKHVMIVSSSLQWVFFLPLAYLSVVIFHQGLIVIWILQGLYRITQAIIFAKIWHNRKWTEIKI